MDFRVLPHTSPDNTHACKHEGCTHHHANHGENAAWHKIGQQEVTNMPEWHHACVCKGACVGRHVVCTPVWDRALTARRVCF